MKLTDEAVALDSVTVDPAVCAQANVSVSSSGSLVADASKTTDSPAATDDGAEIVISGALFAPTTTVTISESDRAPSLTVTSKVNVLSETWLGAVKDTSAVLSEESCTDGPPTCDQLNHSPSPSASVESEASKDTSAPATTEPAYGATITVGAVFGPST